MNQLKNQNNLRKTFENSTYPSVMGRAGAIFLDSLIFGPFILLFLFIQGRINKTNNLTYLNLIILFLYSFLVSIYRIFFTKKNNGTLGKIICKYKIIREDGAPITWMIAIKREAINILLSIIYLIFLFTLYFTNFEIIHNFTDLTVLYSNSILSKIYSILMLVVFIFDYGRARSSLKRQTLHDKIAKTVVVYKYINQ